MANKSLGAAAVVLVMAVLVMALAGVAPAQERIDFNSLPAGSVIDVDFAYQGLLFDVRRTSDGPDVLTLYDTGQRGEPDTDLQTPFDVGNLPPPGPGGNILIIPEYDTDRNDDGLIDQPNDEGSRPAGEMLFNFTTPIRSFGFDLIDVEGPAEYNANAGFFASFYQDDRRIGRVGFGELVDPRSRFYDPTVDFGNNSANRIKPFTAQQFDAPYFDRVVLSFGGSGGTDNLVFTIVPEPSGIALVGIGMVALLGRRRRT